MSRGPGRVMTALREILSDERIMKIDANELACAVYGVARATESQINSVIRAFKRDKPEGWVDSLEPWHSGPVAPNGRPATGHITMFRHKERMNNAIVALARRDRDARIAELAQLDANERTVRVHDEVHAAADQSLAGVRMDVLAQISIGLEKYPIDSQDVNHIMALLVTLSAKRRERLERKAEDKVNETTSAIALLSIAAE